MDQGKPDVGQRHRDIWGHPLAVSGQLAKRVPDAGHHLILMAVI